jgi:thiol-disulfide isomerase/thioredoxin
VPVASLVTRLLLSAVFALAGTAKLADREGSRQAVVDFGAPEWAAGPLAVLVPIAELTAAVLMLFAGTAVAGLALSLALILLFSAAIAVSLARGRAPACHCFGQLHSEPAGWTTLGRNLALAGLAAFGLAASVTSSDRSAVAWIGRLSGAELVALAVTVGAVVILALGGAGFVMLLRSYGRVLVRLERLEQIVGAGGAGEPEPMPEFGLAPGTPAPSRAELDELLEPGLPVLLLFTSVRCGPCKALLPLAVAWQRDHADRLTVAFASDGTAEERRAEAEEFELEQVIADEKLELYNAFEANGTPSAVLISADGTIASWVAAGSDWIDRLVADALEEPPGLPVGAEVPDLALASLGGDEVAFTALEGEDTLLLFWNPDCGYCRAMHDDLLRWEAARDGEEPRLVVVSSGDPDKTRADGFSSLVLLDSDFAAGNVFGANGTPMAVLLGSDGRIASTVVAGADEVMALAGQR